MKVISTKQMRELDRRAIQEFGIPGHVLMENAGFGIAGVVQNLARSSGIRNPTVQVFAGRGNNGGDAFVSARCLSEFGLKVEVFLAGEVGSVRGDALEHLLRMRAAGIEPRELATRGEWEELTDVPLSGGDILVDGLLGTGITGPARGPVAAAIRAINTLSIRGLVVAIDTPSGLNTDTGEATGDVVTADVTATMAFPKCGLVQPSAAELVGSLEVIDIGIPDPLAVAVPSEIDVPTPDEVRLLLGRRRRLAHKGTFGHALVVGGSPGYVGAIAMAAMTAVRSGAGLVSALVPRSLAPTVAGLVPEAMVHGGETTEDETLSADAIDVWKRSTHDFDAILIGPGMGTHPDGLHLIRKALRTSNGPVVLDADALSLCALQLDVLRAASCPATVTPHPGEMARLSGSSVAEVQADRFGVARDMAARMRSTVVLKGAGTVIADVGRPISVNMTGNPGMASGGMGDVLAGLLVGLAAQGLSPYDAARSAAYIHGRAGDNVARYSSQAGMTATDLIAEIPHAFGDISLR